MPQVPRRIGKERAARLRALGDEQYNKFCETRIGAVETVLVEREGLGRTEQFVPIAVPGHAPGEIVAARVTGTSPDGLVGEAMRTAA
jgi:threonylcarbamoyladenosine tRNA methylthiotransferase MtaB